MLERRTFHAVPARFLALGFALTLIGLFALFIRLRTTDGAESPIDGAWLIAAGLAAAFAAGTFAGAWRARARASHTDRSIAALVAAGEKMLGGQRGQRLPRPVRPELAALAALLNRTADLRDSASAVLADRDAQLAAIGSLTGWTYWEQDADGRYTRIESGAGDTPAWRQRLLGRARWDAGGVIVDDAATDVPDAPAGARWAAHRERIAREHQADEFVWSLPGAFGRPVQLREIAIARFSPAGELVGYRGVIRETGPGMDRFAADAMRERARADAARDALEQARARVRALEVSAEELESFSYTVSHDLRAPIRVVDGFARIVKEDFGHALDRVAHSHIDRILAAASRMNGMIDALLSLARVSSGRIETEALDIAPIARRIVEELRVQDPERVVDVCIDPVIHARGDRTLLTMVLENLIGNAWKYSARNPGAKISVDARIEGATTVYRIADNGAGFDMRFADRLFRVFQRLHSASEFPGTGVGLATVARIVRRHGGRIWVDSAPDRGACFYFTLDPDRMPGGADEARDARVVR